MCNAQQLVIIINDYIADLYTYYSILSVIILEYISTLKVYYKILCCVTSAAATYNMW